MFNKSDMGLIDPNAHIGVMRLAVADLVKERDYYRQVIGLTVLDETKESVLLGTELNPMLRLESRPKGFEDRRKTGLFHIAFLLPSRTDLANWLEKFLSLGNTLDGVGDHIVSEALYLHDPEGNGIEVYRDRPRDEWRYQNGNVVMDTLPIDLNDLLQERSGEGFSEAPPETKNGHIHLAVSDVATETDFYHNVLGLGIQAGIFSASFLSAGGYHHHVGLNSWQRSVKRIPDENRLGLQDFEIILPSADAFTPVQKRLDEHGFELESLNGRGYRAIDPDGIGVVFANN